MNPEQIEQQPPPHTPADPQDDNSNVEIDPDVMLQAAMQIALAADTTDAGNDGVHWLGERLEGFKREREQAQV